MGKGGWSFLTRNIHSLAQKKDSTSNRSRNLCFIIKTIHAGIDGLKVDTQVLKLLRILFVEHYKHTVVIFLKIRLISFGKVRMTQVRYAVRSEIARSTQICINGYAVSQKFRAARTRTTLWSCGVAVFVRRTLR